MQVSQLRYRWIEHVSDHYCFQNFGVSFSIISVITGVSSLFLYGLVSVETCSMYD